MTSSVTTPRSCRSLLGWKNTHLQFCWWVNSELNITPRLRTVWAQLMGEDATVRERYSEEILIELSSGSMIGLCISLSISNYFFLSPVLSLVELWSEYRLQHSALGFAQRIGFSERLSQILKSPLVILYRFYVGACFRDRCSRCAVHADISTRHQTGIHEDTWTDSLAHQSPRLCKIFSRFS